MKAVQLGCGLVGRLIATDMSKDFDVTVVDLNEKALAELKTKLPGVKTVKASVTDAESLAPILADADVVTAGIPGDYGYDMMKAVLSLGKSISDISFMPEDFDELNDLAVANGATAVPDMGVAPGMSNFLMGRGASQLDEVEEAYIYVGGIPVDPKPPFNYQATWSPLDCVDEFLRPARYIKDGELVTVEATSGLHLKEFPGVGTLEVFYTDGLRSLAKNIKGKNVGEMTMRYPGHVEQMRLLRSMGLFDKKPRVLAGKEVVPLEMTADLLLPMWKFDAAKGDRDLTVMRVEVRGFKGDDEVTYTWDLLDTFDEDSGYTSMSRCTGCSCAIFARALLEGLITEKGVRAPELLAGDDRLYHFVMAEQEKRGIHYTESVKIVKGARA